MFLKFQLLLIWFMFHNRLIKLLNIIILQDLLKYLSEHYASFSKGHKAIADYIIQNYDTAAFMTAVKLGTAVGISESTVVRFAYEVGYDGYPKLQKALQEMVRNQLTSTQRIAITDETGGEAIY